MFYCLECDNIFDKPVCRSEKTGFWDSDDSERVERCPCCNSRNFKDLSDEPKCGCCGEVCISNYIKTDDNRFYCENCYCTRNIDD